MECYTVDVDADVGLTVGLFVCLTEEDFLLSQAASLEQISTLQPVLDSTYIRGGCERPDP